MDPRSLHERIAADLRAQILSGDLAPASALPSTAQLKKRFDASNATIQKALQLLKSEELVVGRAGASVTVRARRQRTVRPSSYLAAGASGTPSRWLAETDDEAPPARSELLDVAECVPPADVRAVLGTGEPDLAVRRRQLLLLGEEPAELVTAYYPAALARGTALAVRRKIRGGAPAVLAELGVPPHRCVDRVTARVPTQEEHRLLRLPSSVPVLRTLRVAFSADGMPVEATVMVKAGHLYELEYGFGVE
ncbi:GntR family transcriptional regulator [Streptomyces albidoflavus]|uniref:GntR family transcriptional regulator n=1 Tax=Streptomyces TaxID=1883 RepID=UPI001BEAF303|nr:MULTISPECIES: GntR family transcriptional regulator [unclassified Streptomyces]MBT2879963.1 GntR family transcriptional regulator [Streptomyces sp. McG6]MBT2885284.1 GntR family transcriptional regulator [Streptomyces sp. McG5]MBT2892981.1 GntR family transcriptional regulator [Streptomyces sp. McG2]WSB16248.1 GntR family transcriptional regulator [Streptomyces albidoflavus]